MLLYSVVFLLVRTAREKIELMRWMQQLFFQIEASSENNGRGLFILCFIIGFSRLGLLRRV
jgi:hypothetical protein